MADGSVNLTLGEATLSAAGTVTPTPAIIFPVQEISAQQGATANAVSTNTNTISLTFTNPPAVGNGIIVCVGVSGQGEGGVTVRLAEFKVEDNYGNLYYVAAISGNITNTGARIWYIPKLLTTGNPFTITITSARNASPFTPSPCSWLVSAIEVAGVGTKMGVNQTAKVDSASGLSRTLFTPAVTVNDVLMAAVLVFDRQATPGNYVRPEALTPPWKELIEEPQDVGYVISFNTHRKLPGGELNTRAFSGALSQTLRAVWDAYDVYWGAQTGASDAVLAVFQKDGPDPFVPAFISQVVVEAARQWSQDPKAQTSQVVIEAARQWDQNPKVQASQVVVEALRPQQPAAIQVDQVVVEVLRATAPTAVKATQVVVEVLKKANEFASTTTLLSQVAVEFLVTTSATPTAPPNVGEFPVSPCVPYIIPYIPIEFSQDISYVPPTGLVFNLEPRPLDEPEEPPLCADRAGPLRTLKWMEERRMAQRGGPRAVPAGQVWYWYQYTVKPEDNGYVSVWLTMEPGWVPTQNLEPYIDIYGPNGYANADLIGGGQGRYGPLYFNAETGGTYYIRIRVDNKYYKKIKFSIVPGPNKPVGANTVLVNDDGDDTKPLVMMDPATGEVIHMKRPFPDGEWAAMLPNGKSLWSAYDKKLHLYDQTFTEIATLDPPTGRSYHSLVQSDRKNTFYTFIDGDRYVFSVSDTGIIGPKTWGPLPAEPRVFGISEDGKYIYYDNYPGIGRWNMETNQPDGKIYDVDGWPTVELVTLSDGTVIVGMDRYGPESNMVVALRLDPNGKGILNTYEFGPRTTFSLNRITDAPDRMTFWIWMYHESDDLYGKSRFVQVRATDGTFINDMTGSLFAGDSQYGHDQSDHYYASIHYRPDRFGHAFSCPFIVTTQPMTDEEPEPEVPECCQDDYSLWQDNFADVDLAQDYAGWLGVEAFPLELPTGVKSNAYGSYLSKGVAPWGKEFSVEIINNFDELYFFQHDEAPVIDVYNYVRDSNSPGLVLSLRNMDGKAVVWYNPPPVGNLPESNGAFDHSVWHKIRVYGALSTYDEGSESFRSDGWLAVSVDEIVVINRVNIPLYAENGQFNAAREGSWNQVKVYPAGNLTCLYIGNGNFCDEPITQLPGYCPPQTTDGGGTGNSGGNDGADPTEPYQDPDSGGSMGSDCSMGGAVPISPDPPPPESWYT